MSRLKLILSILLMLFLLLVAIFLPSKLREQKETPDPEAQEEAATQEETTQPEELTEMDFLSFEELSQFFSSAQTASLKEQFPVYLTQYRADRHYFGRISAGRDRVSGYHHGGTAFSPVR